MALRGAAAVLRFSSLGDVLLAGHVPSFLREADRGRRVLFVTKRRYALLLAGHPDLERICAVDDGPEELARLRREGIEEILDLHQNLRSWKVRRALSGARVIRPPKHALRRRRWVHARWTRPEPVPPLLATYRAACGLPPGEPAPWLRAALSDAERSRGAERAQDAARGAPFVLLVAGARWETKRWPAERFARLAEAIERSLGAAAVLAAAPGERARAELLELLPPERRGTLLALPFRELAAVAAEARAVVSNDSAALHLGPALGVPAVGIFGGTVPELGFGRQAPRDEVAEIALGCRPCSVHGLDRCPLGHHACMRGLEPETVLDRIARSLGAGVRAG